MKTTVLVDGNNLMWRSYFAGKNLTHGTGYLFLQSLRHLLHTNSVDHVIVFWDGGTPQFRKTLLPTYKDKPLDDETRRNRRRVRRQQRWLMRTLPLLGVEQRWATDFEADDAIAARAINRKPNERILIHTGDRDFWQLVSDEIFICTAEHKLVTPQTFHLFATALGEYATPQAWLAFRCLTGDKSDNVPGVGGIGPVRALRLVEIGARYLERKKNGNETWWPHALGRAMRKVPESWFRNSEQRLLDLNRNYSLMDLRFSERNCYGAHHVKKQKIARARPRRLRRAHTAIEHRGYVSIAEDWRQWARPFRVLQRRQEA